MTKETSIDRYERHLDASVRWLIRSGHRLGGSSAYFSFLTGWSKPYPETTGYIIPTLLRYGRRKGDEAALGAAVDYGEWLLSIRNNDGSWNGDKYPHTNGTPSVFNTAQILFGLLALDRHREEERWRRAALRAARWLESRRSEGGLWEGGHYKGFNPSYYTRVAWPLMAAGKRYGEPGLVAGGREALDVLIGRRNEEGAFRGWGFEKGKPAYTHTIAYTLRGFMEGSLLLDDWERYGRQVEPALERFYHMAERANGRLAGAYDTNWNATQYYTCLTGNAQIALCLLRWHETEPDLRLVNTAGKLMDYNCRSQHTATPLKALNGSLAGSRPVWGRYMFLRYPNCAVKFHTDALMLLTKLLTEESKR